MRQPVVRVLRTGVRLGLAEADRRLRGRAEETRRVVFVFGSQRSGTTLLWRALGRAADTKSYPERSLLSVRDAPRFLRLPAPERVARSLSSTSFPIVVLKPLVESQQAARYLDAVPHARGVWLFRRWRDVAASIERRFGPATSVDNLLVAVAGATGDWRAEGVTADVGARVAALLDSGLDGPDAAALFWWLRNEAFFAQGLAGRDDVTTCCYEELVSSPAASMADLCTFLGIERRRDLAHFSTRSIGAGDDLAFTPAVSELCEAQWQRLLRVHGTR